MSRFRVLKKEKGANEKLVQGRRFQAKIVELSQN